MKNLIDQVRCLFSSKKNRGKQVPILTNWFHQVKQVLVALSIALLLGHANFRDHFQCQTVGQLDKKFLTNFCITNGTTTTLISESHQQPEPHVGLGFAAHDNNHIVINHSYIRSLWALLILIGACSYFPLRKWCSIFEDDTLQALLKLPGFEESKLVSAAEQARPYNKLSPMSRELGSEKALVDHKQERPLKNDNVVCAIASVDDTHNIYNHKLDYYPNQLIYLLLTSNTIAYKCSSLRIRSKLIWYSLWSTSFTLLQFLLPITFLGRQYITYGWKYAVLLKNYLDALAKAQQPALYMNSIDYNLSKTIFPIATQCQYRQHALSGDEDTIVVPCTVAINEICGKLFVVIWWIVVVNIAVELWSLFMIVLGALNFKLMSCVFGYRYWPAMREQAEAIASFRYRRSIIMINMKQADEFRKRIGQLDAKRKRGSSKAQKMASSRVMENDLLSEREKKQLEAQQGNRRAAHNSERGGFRSDGWLVCSCLQVLSGAFLSLITGVICCLTRRRRNYYETEDKKDINIFFLLYLMYLRLGNSRSKVEQVIHMTSVALDGYLSSLKTNNMQMNYQGAPMAKLIGGQNSTKGAEEELDDEKQKQMNKRLLNKEGTTIVDMAA